MRERWLSAGLVFSTLFWLAAWYWDTGRSMVSIWARSDTFAHGFLIVPISAWLIWQRRYELPGIDFRPNFWGLALLALTGFGWLLGYLAGAGVVQQFAVVLMVPLVVWVLLGNSLARALCFPLLFLLLAVPLGEFLTEPLMQYTADFTVLALRLSGIPVYREGLYFTIPSGSWSVVEACSGLRYLIASMTLGLLYAYLTYRTFWRRALFVAASLVVPVIANWLRAYMIVMIGHLSSMKYAVGIDHLIYGWVFFGLVMMLLFWVGSFWREDLGGDVRPAPGLQQPGATNTAPMLAAAIGTAVVLAAWPLAGARLMSGHASKNDLASPAIAEPWKPDSGELTSWTPRFPLARVQLDQVYGKGEGRVGLKVRFYPTQRADSQLISSQNVLVPTSDAEWAVAGERKSTVTVQGEDLPVMEAQLRSRSTRLLVWRWYWVDGALTVNPYVGKLLQAKSALLGRGGGGALIIVYAEIDARADAAQRAAERLRNFTNASLPGVMRSLADER